MCRIYWYCWLLKNESLNNKHLTDSHKKSTHKNQISVNYHPWIQLLKALSTLNQIKQETTTFYITPNLTDPQKVMEILAGINLMELINMSCFKDLVLIAAGEKEKKPSTSGFLPCMAGHWARTGHYRYIAGLKFSLESTAVKSAVSNYSKLCCKTKNNAHTHIHSGMLLKVHLY